MAKRPLRFLVEIRVPEDATGPATRRYIHDAIRSHGGAYHPDDPFFGLKMADISVMQYRAPKKPGIRTRK